MNPQFNQNELAAIANLLNRVNITGQEATTVAVLLQKVNSLIQQAPAAPEGLQQAPKKE